MRYDRDGTPVMRIRAPARQPSSCCLAGEHGSTLMITSARHGLCEPGSEDGLIFACDVETPGTVAISFRGAIPINLNR
jgi:sugar lactone lactonase YvrE